MRFWKVYFGSERSVGVEVEAPTEREARIRAMDVLRENREQTKWSASGYVNWEDSLGDTVMVLDPRSAEYYAEYIILNKSGEAVYGGPPRAQDFGSFPPIVRIDEI